jgi:hypothetical protein
LNTTAAQIHKNKIKIMWKDKAVLKSTGVKALNAEKT